MTQTRESMLRKIKALLSKTEQSGCTEAEAMAALSLSAKLMQEHEVNADELREAQNDAAVLEVEQHTNEVRGWLSQSVGRFTQVQIWRSNKTINYCGQAGDVEFAKWLLKSLTGFVFRQLVDHLQSIQKFKTSEAQKLAAHSFKLGCCNRINQRLNELAKGNELARTSNGKELMIVKEQQIAARMKAAGIALITRTGRAPQDAQAYRLGQLAGNEAQFSRPLDSNSQPPPKALTHG